MALLVQLRVLERRGRAPRAGLATAGRAGAAHEILLDHGVPIRYYVGAR